MVERRVCIYSQRGLSRHVSRCGAFEFEDLIATQFESADIIVPQKGTLSHLLLKVRNRLSQKTSHYWLVPAGLKLTRLSHDYDLLFCIVSLSPDLLTIGALGDLRARAARAVCWVQELWVNDIAKLGPQLDILNSFDHVLCTLAGSVDALAQRLDVPVTYMPWGVDTELFCPYPQELDRVIDVINISRANDTTHNALVSYARETGAFYDFPTVTGIYDAFSPAEHRRLYADRLKRSRYFFAHMAKVARQVERGTQEEFGARYIEGVASGTVVLGDRLSTPGFENNLGWTDSVIEVPYECASVASIIEELDSQPERLAEARRRNVLNALRRHDHLHRWEKVLDVAGLPHTDGMRLRRSRIDELVAIVESGG